MQTKRIILIRAIKFEIVSLNKLNIVVDHGFQKLEMEINGRKKVSQIQSLLNEPNIDKLNNFKIDLAKKVLLFNDFYFDEVELI